MLLRLVKLFLILVLLGALTLQAQGQSGHWLQSPFYFDARNEKLSSLLTYFCESQGVTAVVSPKIKGTVSGNFAFANPGIFLDVLARNNRLSWYFDGNAAYFYTLSEIESAVVQLRWLSPERLQETLESMGLYDARFQWHALPEERIVYISGPPRYVNMVRSLVSKLENSAASDMTMKVFHLNHAWADDISINFMEKEMNIPGIATLLREITGSDPSRVKPKVETIPQMGVLEAKEQEDYSETTRDNYQKQWSNAARIMADPGRNAVIVWDVRERMPYYEQAIAQLDTPVGLVEIRAAIIDVSTNRLDELGISWSVNNNVNLNTKTGNDGVGAVGGSNVGSGDSAVDFFSNQGSGLNLTTIYTSGIDQLMMRVTAIENDGDANVLSRPAVLTLDNVQAMLQNTNTFYVKLQGKDAVDLYDVTYGTVLKVTPHIIKDEKDGSEQVKLIVNIEDGKQNAAATGSDNIPVVSKSTINTQAIVGKSQALIIGGHYYEEHNRTNSGIPKLKNVPLLGSLFGTDSNTVKKIERLFVISPKIVDLKAIAMQQERIKQETFTRTIVHKDSIGPIPEPPSSAGCARKNVSATPQ